MDEKEEMASSAPPSTPGAAAAGRPALRRVALWPIAPLCAAAAVILFFRLGRGSLYDWDEAIFAQVAKEMLQRGDWLTLRFNGEPYFNKPPLLMWCTATLYAIFGVSELTARAVSAVAGVALVGVTFLIGRRLYGAATGALAAVVLLTTYRFVAHARFGTTDILLTACIYAAVAFYLEVRRGRPWGWIGCGAAAGLALLAKGPPGLIAPVALVLAAAWDGRLRPALRSPALWMAAVLMSAPVVAWYVAQLLAHQEQLALAGQTLVERISSPLEGHEADLDFYIDRLRGHFVPWFPLVPFAVALALRDLAAGRAEHRLPALLAGLMFFGFTAVQTKLYWYVLPMYPALALLIAAMATEALRRPRSVAWSALLVATLVPLLAATAAIAAGFLLLALALGVTALLAPPRVRARAPAAAALLCLSLIVAIGLNGLRPLYRGVETYAAQIARMAGAAAPRQPLIVMCTGKLYKPAILFYSERPIIAVWNVPELAAALPANQPRDIIIYEPELAGLGPAYHFDVRGRRTPYLYAVVTRRPDRESAAPGS